MSSWRTRSSASSRPRAPAGSCSVTSSRRDFVEKGRALGLSDEDLVATATAFTAESIAFAYREFILPRFTIDEILLAGGGANNLTLVRMIEERLAPIPIDSIESLGYPVQAREVMAMMVIGNETVQGKPRQRTVGNRRGQVRDRRGHRSG